jgi:alkanesulfonate monooxygenase SsuD/methylene tetrahydromethanopterin reductase-like flavin-dependent oxidoreductase (luciferase family)
VAEKIDGAGRVPAPGAPRFGLALVNRGVVIGASDLEEIRQMATLVDTSPAWDSLWVGDSILAKPRIDSLVLLSLLSGITERVRLGVGCLASTPLRNPLLLAYQWASLDNVAHGRTIFVACQGEGAQGGGAFFDEYRAFGIDPRTRMRRLEEAVEIMRLTSTGEAVSFEGEYASFSNVAILPAPLQRPLPIWLAANPNPNRPRHVESALRRVARLGDGWMTTMVPVEDFGHYLEAIRSYGREYGRDLGQSFAACAYYNVHVDDNEERALRESKRFLDSHSSTDYGESTLKRWVIYGSPERCIARLREVIAAGATDIVLRISSFNQLEQFRRVTSEVLGAFE